MAGAPIKRNQAMQIVHLMFEPDPQWTDISENMKYAHISQVTFNQTLYIRKWNEIHVQYPELDIVGLISTADA